jgi:hypothetical protein
MRARTLVLSSAPALALAAIAAAAPPAPARPDDPETGRIRREVQQLRSERDLASGKGFYLRLDAGGPSLALMLQGVTLDEYPASGLAWGVPEVLFVDRKPAADWDAAAFSKGRLEPERERDRLEVVAPPPSTGAGARQEAASPSPPPPPPPRSAEESYSVPSPYRIVFAESVSLEVRSKGDGGRNRSAFRRFADALHLRLSDLGTALGLGAKERIRLRVTLEAEHAASLYRSLPPDVGLIVVGFPGR